MALLEEHDTIRKRIAMRMMADFETPSKTGCSGGAEVQATEDQRALALILHWLRTRKKTLAWCQKNKVFPSPKGYKVKVLGKGRQNVIWLPAQHESCKATVDLYPEVHDAEGMVHITAKPYAWWDHCKSYEHCLYLAVSDPYFFTKQLGEDIAVPAYIGATVVMDKIPMLASSTNELSQEFFASWCAGEFRDIHRGDHV